MKSSIKYFNFILLQLPLLPYDIIYSGESAFNWNKVETSTIDFIIQSRRFDDPLFN